MAEGDENGVRGKRMLLPKRSPRQEQRAETRRNPFALSGSPSSSTSGDYVEKREPHEAVHDADHTRAPHPMASPGDDQTRNQPRARAVLPNLIVPPDDAEELPWTPQQNSSSLDEKEFESVRPPSEKVKPKISGRLKQVLRPSDQRHGELGEGAVADDGFSLFNFERTPNLRRSPIQLEKPLQSGKVLFVEKRREIATALSELKHRTPTSQARKSEPQVDSGFESPTSVPSVGDIRDSQDHGDSSHDHEGDEEGPKSSFLRNIIVNEDSQRSSSNTVHDDKFGPQRARSLRVPRVGGGRSSGGETRSTRPFKVNKRKPGGLGQPRTHVGLLSVSLNDGATARGPTLPSESAEELDRIYDAIVQDTPTTPGRHPMVRRHKRNRRRRVTAVGNESEYEEPGDLPVVRFEDGDDCEDATMAEVSPEVAFLLERAHDLNCRLRDSEKQLATLMEAVQASEDILEAEMSRLRLIMNTLDQAQEIRYRSVLDVFTDNFRTVGVVETRLDQMMSLQHTQLQRSGRGRLASATWRIADFVVACIARIIELCVGSYKVAQTFRRQRDCT